MSSIYRKYRPQTFAEMVGQNHIKLTLESELEQGSFVHAYLFCGPRGLGKTTAARLFAKSVNCENRQNGQSEPCNKCQSCLAVMNGKSLDLMEIDAASHTGVDNVRENIIENTRFAPHKSKYKVFIIDEVHMLSISAFNALLKTLEEPPSHVIFILCTTELHKVPETIISRCQRFDFKKVPVVEMIRRLKRITQNEGIKLEDEIYNVIAYRSEGCMRDAEVILGQILSLGGSKISKEQAALVIPMSEIKLVLELVDLLVHGNLSASLDLVNQLVEEGVNLTAFNKELIEFLRKLLLVKVGVGKTGFFDFDSYIEKQINIIINLADAGSLLKMINSFLLAGYDLKSASIVQLPLELAIMKICGTESANPVNLSRPASPVSFGRPANPAIEPEKVKSLRHLSAETLKHKSIEVPEQEAVDKESKVDFERISSQWVNVVRASHKKSRDLTFINERMVWPVKAIGGALEIGFTYDLHKNRFETNSNKMLFEEALYEITGSKINVIAKTLKPSEIADFEIARASDEAKNQQLNNTKVTDDNILEHVLDSFGGEVVEE
ncbi:MAG: DNA polymerase III subunit gamma/tau [Candidatus Kuenenbacteria bacterium]